jgi:hypothetical protein
MQRSVPLAAAIAIWAVMPFLMGAEGTSSPYSDAVNDIDPGITDAGGTLDILGMEVSNTATDLNFKLTVNGNVGTTDWGNFMIGIATGKTAGTVAATGNGWARPINITLDAANPSSDGMNYWIGSWVNGGGGSQLWTYDNTGSSWSGPAGLAGYSFTAGATSEINYTLALTDLNLSPGDTFSFDAYSSGGGGTDSAIDSLANPNVSITDWAGPYTSSPTATGGNGLNTYTVAVPEPQSLAIVAAIVAAAGFGVSRRLRRGA